MNDDTNPYLKKLDQIYAAQTKWQESEWHLSFLRTEGEFKPKTLTDEELLQWAKKSP